MRVKIQIPSPVFCFIKNKEFEIIKEKKSFVVKTGNNYIHKNTFFQSVCRYHQFVRWQLAPVDLRNHKLGTKLLFTNEFLLFHPKLITDESINLFEIHIRLHELDRFKIATRLILNKNYIFIRPLLKKDTDTKSNIIKTDLKSILIEMYNDLPQIKKEKVLKRIRQMYRGTKRKRH